MDFVVGFLDSAYTDEESVLGAAGIAVRRISLQHAVQPDAWGGGRGDLLLRGPRLGVETYDAILHAARAAGMEPVTDSDSYRFGVNLQLQAGVLGSLAPRTIFLPASCSPYEISMRLVEESPDYPVFVRSEVKSAAKFVGLEGCLLRDGSLAEVARVVGNLVEHVGAFSTLLLKEVHEIVKASDGVKLEYRSVGRDGRLVAFDWKAGDASPDPSMVGLDGFAGTVYQTIARGGVRGAVVCDVALASAGRGFVVECKNLSDSTLRHPLACIRALAR